MAASTVKAEQTSEVFPWLRTLPLAPEYHPTLAEFQDPISYIFKIEKEASKYGICKIVPPVLPNPKKTAITNLNRSLAARARTTDPKSAPTFTTRQQQIGFCPRKPRPVQRPVWQSGEYYTFQQFEAKAKSFEKSYLKKSSKKGLTPLEIETLYWKASVDKPFSVEYANDMPGSAFVPVSAKKSREAGDAATLGETAWNMRGVSRAKGSLLRFMKEEIPGVTSPMVYVAMLFSWFAWHVEDHDLHSLNYMHMGAGKTWYGVPRDAAVAFEDVVRIHGYGGEINPLVTFEILGEKTTVMSPEVFLKAGIPCCRLVQNPGEFVVTFPRAYHSGFSHGFNCGEAANIATPEWLRVAKHAAIRRASINYPPMVSHFQLLYDLALALSSRIPTSVSSEPRSSRLKDKKKGEGESMVKKFFVQNVIQNNDLLQNLGKGSSIVILPQSSSDISGCSNLRVGSHLKAKPRLYLGLCNQEETLKASNGLVSNRIMLDSSQGAKQLKSYYSVKEKFASLCEKNRLTSLSGNEEVHPLTSQTWNKDTQRDGAAQGDGLSDRRLFSCVTCGILSFACVAIIQPREAAARYLMSADCSFFNDWSVGSGVTSEVLPIAWQDSNTSELNANSGWMKKSVPDGLYDVPIQSSDYQILGPSQGDEGVSDIEEQEATTALGLLALNYGNSSDSDEDHVEPDIPDYADQTNVRNSSPESRYKCNNSTLSSSEGRCLSSLRLGSDDEVPVQISDSFVENGYGSANFKIRGHQTYDCSVKFETDYHASMESNNSDGTLSPQPISLLRNPAVPIENTNTSLAPRSDEDSSRMHVFCLEHAVEVEQQLRPIGGVHILLLCHPDYPKVEAEAKLVAEELGFDHTWKDIAFRDATREDEESIQSALDSEEAVPGNGDWAVKLGINLYYSALLSRSPLYSKQMPYNTVIYNAFGCQSPANSPSIPKVYGKGSNRQKKAIVAGKWCGKVWMSNQVHPLLLPRDPEEQEHEVEEKSCHAWSKPDEKPERKSESNFKAEVTKSTRKAGRKRKMAVDRRPIKIATCTKVEYRDRDSDISEEDCPPLQYSRRSVKKAKCPEIEDPVRDSDNSEEDRPPLQYSRRSVKKAKCPEIEDPVRDSDNSEEDRPPRQYSRRSVKKAKCPEIEDPVRDSDNSEEDCLPRQYSRRSVKKAKCPEIEDPVRDSDDSAGDGPLEVLRRLIRSKHMKEETPQIQNKCKQNSRLFNSYDDDDLEGGPSTRLRKRPVKESVAKPAMKKQVTGRRVKKTPAAYTDAKIKDEDGIATKPRKTRDVEEDYQCDIDGCVMSFCSKQELLLHKRNVCPVKGCGKKFFSHKYLVQHRRVHVDERPLKCPWKGCRMTFKWAWARTEHIRVHTGARPYVCGESSCGQTFRFVSDFSRHKRKTGHSTKKKGRG